MPIFDLKCSVCGKVAEMFVWPGGGMPECCATPMVRLYTVGKHLDKYSAPLWVGRMEEIHKAQEQRGERLRMVYPKEVGAT